jgi:hypothetical protein
MSLAVVTPSHAPDLASFRRLHASVLRWSDPGVRHIVAVPELDVPLFRTVGDQRLEVVGYRGLLPREFVQTTRLARLKGLPRGYRIGAVNSRRPWPPIRGWMLQQIVKLALVSRLDDDVALLIDSDVLAIAPLDETVFRRDGSVRLYRFPHGVDDSMTRHRRWLDESARLLGMPTSETDSPDYIAPFNSWSPTVVRAALDRVSEVSGMPWSRTIGASLDFSEFMLVGSYTSAQHDGATFASDRSLCHSHWDPRPLDLADAQAFAETLEPDDLAIHIQSNSDTSEDVLRWVAERFGERG